MRREVKAINSFSGDDEASVRAIRPSRSPARPLVQEEAGMEKGCSGSPWSR